jgi:hypothetical protein
MTGCGMLLGVLLIVSGIGLILLARYRSERDSWRTRAILWKKAAKRWQESYEIMSDGFDALWRMNKKQEGENHE